MRLLILSMLASVTPLLVTAQTFFGDSILAHERSIDRPITLHRDQLRVTGEYALSFISHRFDRTGALIDLKDAGGLRSVRHRFILDIKYGINDYVQVSAGVAQTRQVVREPSMRIFPDESEPIVTHDVRREYSGLEDLSLGVDLRAPLNTRKLDLSISLGASLPIASHKPPEPEHTFTVITSADNRNDHHFVYRYRYPSGKGVTVARMGAMAKYRMQRWAFSARVDYTHGLEEGENLEWRHQLGYDGEFEYRSEPFTFRIPDAFSYWAEVEFQPRPRVDVFLNAAGYTAFHGWTEFQDGLKIAIPYQTTWVLSPGAEIIITPRLWLRERVLISVSGKSFDAPFAIQTSLMYNLFPFK